VSFWFVPAPVNVMTYSAVSEYVPVVSAAAEALSFTAAQLIPGQVTSPNIVVLISVPGDPEAKGVLSVASM